VGGAKDEIKKLVNVMWLTADGNGVSYLEIERLSENIVKRFNLRLFDNLMHFCYNVSKYYVLKKSSTKILRIRKEQINSRYLL